MKIKKLFKDIQIIAIKGSKEVELTGITSHSRYIFPGNLFIVKRGFKYDGSNFINEAMQAGAVAILSDIYNPFIKDIVQIIHPNPKSIEGLIAARFYKFPSEKLFTIGITGTNGKTTTSFLIKHLFDGLDEQCGLLGTIEYIIGEKRKKALTTTPDVISNQKMLHEMLQKNCKAVSMEVTSHGLDQSRVGYIDFDVAVFTNFSLDHLDYHKTIESYFCSKAKLFSSLVPSKNKKIKKAILNADSKWSKNLSIPKGVEVVTYGIDSKASVKADNIILKEGRTELDIIYKGDKAHLVSNLIGRFNVYNLLAAISVAISKGFALQKCIDVLQTFSSVSGRLEKVENRLGLNIYVDYAHTDDALKKVLTCLREFKKGRLITVFGCGGNRDKSKRPKMGKVSEILSDYSIITSDNPRSEHPLTICENIAAGYKDTSLCEIEVDRKKAIIRAIEIAKKDDLILIAGKGHEKEQLFSYQTVPFDDKIVAYEACQKISFAASLR